MVRPWTQVDRVWNVHALPSQGMYSHVFVYMRSDPKVFVGGLYKTDIACTFMGS